MASIFDYARRIPILGDTIDSVSGRDGLKTAAEGAKAAQAQAQALADLQWQRQMEGLQRAQMPLNNYRSLYDRIYGTSTATANQWQPPQASVPQRPAVFTPTVGLPQGETRAAQPAGAPQPQLNLGALIPQPRAPFFGGGSPVGQQTQLGTDGLPRSAAPMFGRR